MFILICSIVLIWSMVFIVGLFTLDLLSNFAPLPVTSERELSCAMEILLLGVIAEISTPSSTFPAASTSEE